MLLTLVWLSNQCLVLIPYRLVTDLCEVALPTTSTVNEDDPTLTDGHNVPYYLTYYRREMTVRNEISRFLQQNTFGPTKEELDAMEARYNTLRGPGFVPPEHTWEELTPILPSGVLEDLGEACAAGSSNELCDHLDEIHNASVVAWEEEAAGIDTPSPTPLDENATETSRRQLQGYDPSNSTSRSHAEAMSALQLEWVANQMDPSTFSSGEFTSLRKYWRRRLNARKTETYRIGESGPHACEKHSRWRKFAFTKTDVEFAMDLRWGSKQLGGTIQKHDGHLITVERVVR